MTLTLLSDRRPATRPPDLAIEATGLVKRFGARTALDGVDLAAPTGSVLGVLGPNGAGKTTAMRIMATLCRPDAGSARVCGLDVVAQADRVRRVIGVSGQSPAVDEHLTARQNLQLVGRLLGLNSTDATARGRELLARFSLTEAGDRSPRAYCGGLRRRLDLALSLVGRPRVLCLDEPTAGLDPNTRAQLWEVVRELVADGVTVLLTTRHLEEAERLADRIVVIAEGSVVAAGTPRELKATVGRRRLELRPDRPEELDRIAVIAARVVGELPERLPGDLLSLPIGDLALPPAVLCRLDEAGLRLAGFALRRPTLDEVVRTPAGTR